MPSCLLSQEFIVHIFREVPIRTIHYADIELRGFFLEHRPSGIGTWYLRYRIEKNKIQYFRLGRAPNMNAIVAREWAYRVLSVVRRGDDPKVEFGQKANLPLLTMRKFITEHYLPHTQLKKRSWELDKRVLTKYFLPDFGAYTFGSINHVDLVMWQDSLPLEGLQASSCNRIFSAVRAVFYCAVRWGFIEDIDNPCKNIAPFPEIPPRTRCLNNKEVRKVVQALQSMGKNKRALALQLLLFTGARKSEILSARWEHTHVEDRVLTVPLSKSGKVRHIPLSDKAIAIIKTIPKHEDSPWLFPAANPNKHIVCLFRTWHKVRRSLKLSDVRIHDLRHSFASFLINSGCTLYEVQKILGHQNPKVTMRYAHLSQKSLVKAANCVGRICMEKINIFA